MANAPMSNGYIGRMVETIKKSAGRLAAGSERDWDEELTRVMYD